MPAPQEVSDLIERFDRNRESYRSSEYNETQARREFIDPFFKALDWDIDNEQGYAEAYKDVVHMKEDRDDKVYMYTFAPIDRSEANNSMQAMPNGAPDG
jgi:predicted type IV restriction endonuclease